MLGARLSLAGNQIPTSYTMNAVMPISDASRTPSTATTIQGAGFVQSEVPATQSIEQRVLEAWRSYAVDTLGRSEEFARSMADRSLNAVSCPRIVPALQSASGRSVAGLRVLDVGSGLGDAAIEIARSGALVTAVEPCEPWRRIAESRVQALGLPIDTISADAHHLPFADGSFDVVLTLQVLEHVRDPQKVIREISRVLKPQGLFFIRCENYLSFREQHYGVAWLPLLPKSMASIYLRLRGRDPKFLREHVTYVDTPHLIAWLVGANLVDTNWEQTIRRVELNELNKKERIPFRILNRIWGRSCAIAFLVHKDLRINPCRVGFTASGHKREAST